MTQPRDEKSYAFLMPFGPDGEMATMDAYDTRWRVAVARPREGSTTERDLSEVQEFEDELEAARAFCNLMGQGLHGVVDSPNRRIFGKCPDEIFEELTDAMNESCDAIPEEDRRDDDWDNTEFTPLRDAMQDVLEDVNSAPAP